MKIKTSRSKSYIIELLLQQSCTEEWPGYSANIAMIGTALSGPWHIDAL